MSSSSSSSSSSSTDSSGSSSDSSSSDTEQSAGSQRSAPRSPGKSPKQQPQQAERRKSSGSSAPAKPTSRSDAQGKSASRKVSSTTGGAAAARSSSTTAAPPARSAPKSPVRRAAADSKTAKKSIFSPDESSASEPESKPNAKQTNKKTSRRPNGSAKNSSVSSSRACSGVDSGSSSAAEEADGASAAGSARLPATTAPPKQSGTPGTAAAAAGSSDSEAVRRRTRSARPSRSQMKRSAIYNTDSESETADSQQGTKGPRKKKRAGGGSGAPARPVADQPPPQRAPTMGEGGCPVPGCDSRGHLSGLYERHFTRMACPLYHRTTDAQAKDHQLEREIRTSDRQRALNKYRAGQTTPEQKSYMSRVTSQRRQAPENTERKPETVEEDRSREIELDSLAPSYDVALFREAQAAASAQIEDNLRHLPDTPGLHSIEMGRFDMEVWYQSPYPDDFPRGSKMFICQYCLKYLRCRTSLERHNAKCVWRFPPGDEIYRKDALSVFEVDGRRFKGYCQNLCLLAKLFLDNKTLYFDVEPFLFYVMTVADSEGCHVVGYFSKEKNSFLNYNVSCIMTLPPYQRQGYGRLLIDFSYLLTKTENKIGSPEKPLSDLGLISYRSYWKDALLRYLSDFRGKVVSIKDISQEMAANSNDIVSTLQAVGIVKYWKNKHIILKRQDIFEDFEEKRSRRGPDHKEIDPKCLTWKPFQAPEQNKSS